MGKTKHDMLINHVITKLMINRQEFASKFDHDGTLYFSLALKIGFGEGVVWCHHHGLLVIPRYISMEQDDGVSF